MKGEERLTIGQGNAVLSWDEVQSDFDQPLTVQGTVVGLPIESLVVDSEQVRGGIARNDKKFKEFCESIRESGIPQPSVVRRICKGKYQILWGHRWYFAAREVGEDKVPCLIQSEPLTDADRVQIILVEDIRLDDLSPIEQAEEFARLQGQGLSQKQIARGVGKSKYYVNKALAFRNRFTVEEWKELRKVATSQHIDFSRLEEASKINEPELRRKALFSDIPVCEIRSLRKGLAQRTRPKREEPRKYKTRLKEDALSSLLEISGELRSREDVISISQKLVEQFCHEHRL